MKLGIGSYTFPWAIGLSGATPPTPLRPLQLLARARELGVGLVQFGPNLALDRLAEVELRDLIDHAESWNIDLEMSTLGVSPETLKEKIQFAKRCGMILLKTSLELPGGRIPMRPEIAHCLRSVVEDLEREGIGLAIDNSSLPAPELNGVLESVCSPWLGAALDTASPTTVLQGWQVATRVLAHRTLSLHIKDFVVHAAAHGMGFTVQGCPVGKGRLNVPWLVESFAALRVKPSAILESWTPAQPTLDETIALEAEWAKQGVKYLRRFIPD